MTNLFQIKARLRVIQLAFSDSLKNTLSDRGAVLIILFAGIVYPIVYGIAYSKERIFEMPVAVIDNDQSNLSRQWIEMLNDNPAVQVHAKVDGMPAAKKLFWEGEVLAIFHVPVDFEKQVTNGQQAYVGMYADASNFLYYKETMKATMVSSGMLGAGVQIKKLMLKGMTDKQAMATIQPFQSQVVNLYNPAGGYGAFLMPGMLLIIAQQTLLIGIGLVGGAGRERKRDKSFMQANRFLDFPFEMMMGKAAAFFVVAMVPMIFAIIPVSHWFGYPNKGELWNVFILIVPYLWAIIFLGLAISVFFKHREHAIMFLVFLSPLVLFLTGLSWPAGSIPEPLRILYSIFPSTHMVPAYVRLRTMGVELEHVHKELIFLLVQCFVYYFLAVMGFKWIMRKDNVVAMEE